METYILFQKTILLKKNKWSPLSIPVLFNAVKDEFILEAHSDETGSGLLIEFDMKAIKTQSDQPNTLISVQVENIAQHVSPEDIEGVSPLDYLLLACRSPQDGRLLLSIRKK